MIMKDSFSYVPYSLRTNAPFGTAHGVRSHTEIMIVRLSYDGITGYGEASMPPYYPENQQSMADFFSKIDIGAIKACDSPNLLHAYLSSISERDTGAKAAVDIAFHDRMGKAGRYSVAEYYDISPRVWFDSCYTIGVAPMQEMINNVLEVKDFKYIKIKLNGTDDLKIIKAIREVSDQPLWVDANQSWINASYASTLIRHFEELGVEMIEQPFKVGQYGDVFQLAEETDIPIVADEDCQRLIDIPKLSRYYDGINIKLMKCTGLYEAKQMIALARTLDMKVMIGCMSETSIGISAAAQLAYLVNWVDLDGNMSLSNDPCAGVKHINGRIKLQDMEGIGLTDTDGLERLFIEKS